MAASSDRAVQALIDDGWLGDLDELSTQDLASIVAMVVRVLRDDVMIAWAKGQAVQVTDVESLLNNRIKALTGRNTVTGDTT